MKVNVGDVVLFKVPCSTSYESKIMHGRIRGASANSAVYSVETPANPVPSTEGSYDLKVRLVAEMEVLDVVPETK